MTLATGLGLLLVVGNLLFAATISGQAQRLLVTRADAQIAALTVRPAGVFIRPTHNDGTLDDRAWIFSQRRLLERPAQVPAAVDRLAVSLGSQPGTSRTAAVGEYRVKRIPLSAGTPARQVGAVVVEINVAAFDSLTHKVLLGSLAMAAILLLVVGLAVDHALRGALGPVGTMTEAAADWSEHDLDRRFAVGPPRDEIGGLAATLDRLLDRIAASRRHERRFAADVAHELRTPLAAIRGRVDLSLDARGGTDDHAAALRSVGAQAALGQDWHAARPILRVMDVTSEDTTSSAERHIRDVAIHGGVDAEQDQGPVTRLDRGRDPQDLLDRRWLAFG